MIMDLEKLELRITKNEILDAIENTNPNKAIGIDNITLKPLDREECAWIKFQDKDYF